MKPRAGIAARTGTEPGSGSVRAAVGKLRLGIFPLTSDAGCQLEFLNLEDDLLALAGAVDILHFPMARAFNEEGPFDVAFIDGVPARRDELRVLREVRRNAGVLVALGSCASFGGVPASQRLHDLGDLKKYVYRGMEGPETLEVFPISSYVRVDVQLRGCPASKWEIMETVSALIAGRLPQLKAYPQCVECKIAENRCLLLEGLPCLGPITRAGCGVVCPSVGVPCDGCRGPTEEPNLSSIVEVLARGTPYPDLIRKFEKYCSLVPEYQELFDHWREYV